jgi:hypothetical protein
MIDTSKMTDTAFLRTLRMRFRSADQPEITIDEVRRLLDIASGLRIDPSLLGADLPAMGLGMRHHREGRPDA